MTQYHTHHQSVHCSSINDSRFPTILLVNTVLQANSQSLLSLESFDLLNAFHFSTSVAAGSFWGSGSGSQAAKVGDKSWWESYIQNLGLAPVRLSDLRVVGDGYMEALLKFPNPLGSFKLVEAIVILIMPSANIALGSAASICLPTVHYIAVRMLRGLS